MAPKRLKTAEKWPFRPRISDFRPRTSDFGPRLLSSPVASHFQPPETPFAVVFRRKMPLARPHFRDRHYVAPYNQRKADLARMHKKNGRSYSRAGQPPATRPRSPPPAAGGRLRPLPFPHKADLGRRTRHYAERSVPHKADLAQVPRFALPLLSPCRPIGYTIDNTPDPPYPRPTQTNRPILHKADLKSVE